MEMNSDPSIVFEAENDDDVFYAEIERQILLLTTDDNEDLPETKHFNSFGAANGGSSRSVSGFPGASPLASRFCSWETEYSGSPPVWLVNLWKNGKGTGVFIPEVVKCRRNYKPGKDSSLFSFND